MGQKTIPARIDVPVEHTWDAGSVFPTDQEWEAEFQGIERRLPDLAEFKDHLAEGPPTLADWFATSEDVLRAFGKVSVYTTLFASVDSTDQAAAARAERARGLGSRVDAAMSFAEPEMLAIGIDKLLAWAAEEPRLAVYRHYFDRLRKRQEHIRSAEVEELLSQAADPFGTAASLHGILANADLTFPSATDAEGDQHEVAQGTVNALLANPDRQVRRTAWESYADAHLALRNTMATALAAGVKRDVFVARARRYPSSLDAALAPNHTPAKVLHNP